VSDLLLITDMARLSRVFERLADDNTFSIRVVNNLEKGGEEIAIQKPDVVFVQTHISGLSADILLKHLKKQLGRKRSRFVLLATPGQVSNDVLKLYKGWLDISCKDSELLSATQSLLTSLLSKPQTPEVQIQREEITIPAHVSPEPVTIAETSVLLCPQPAAVPEASLEDQGLTYSPRSRLSVYSEFNSSFDSAVERTPEPESVVKASPLLEHNWNTELIETVETVSPRSKSTIFMLWLAPVVVAVVVVTLLQKNRSDSKPVTVIASQAVSLPTPPKPVDQTVAQAIKLEEPSKLAVSAKPDQVTDKAVITSISENRGAQTVLPPSTATARLTVLPDFIPRNGLDKQYGIDNRGWERYRGEVTEFKVLREAQTIKVIQVIDRGGHGVPESFMRGVLKQAAKNRVFTVETTEKKEGYEIQRGHVTENLKVVCYRDEQGGKLRAFVMNWQ